MINTTDLLSCENCSAEADIEQMRSTDDGCYLCPKCAAKADAAFKVCKHQWQPARDQYGDEGYYCPKCSHIVARDYVDADQSGMGDL